MFCTLVAWQRLLTFIFWYVFLCLKLPAETNSLFLHTGKFILSSSFSVHFLLFNITLPLDLLIRRNFHNFLSHHPHFPCHPKKGVPSLGFFVILINTILLLFDCFSPAKLVVVKMFQDISYTCSNGKSEDYNITTKWGCVTL